MIAYCGLTCSECPAFIATKENNDEKRKKTAERWSSEYNADIKPEDINCDGCVADGKTLFSYPRICEIRICGMEKGVENCAHCDDYACGRLTGFFKLVPAAQTTLEGVRKTL